MKRAEPPPFLLMNRRIAPATVSRNSTPGAGLHLAITPLLHHSIPHSALDSLKPFPPFSSVWGGGWQPPREGGAAE
jgi:hypothetical protein